MIVEIVAKGRTVLFIDKSLENLGVGDDIATALGPDDKGFVDDLPLLLTLAHDEKLSRLGVNVSSIIGNIHTRALVISGVDGNRNFEVCLPEGRSLNMFEGGYEIRGLNTVDVLAEIKVRQTT